MRLYVKSGSLDVEFEDDGLKEIRDKLAGFVVADNEKAKEAIKIAGEPPVSEPTKLGTGKLGRKPKLPI